jgi:tetratricopeptide (TPR) repeat protein
MPALPLLAGLAGFVVAILRGFRERGARRSAHLGAAAILASIATGPLNARVGFDSAESMRSQYEFLVGGVLVEQGRFDEAERRFRASSAAGYAPAEAALADVFRRQGRRAEALAALRALVRADPANAAAHRGLAVALAEGKQYGEAESEFRAALARDPNDWESLSGLGNVLHATGRLDEAIAQHQAAIERNPSYAPAHYNLACVYFLQERFAEAEKEFRAALRVDPLLAEARWYLADMLQKRGAYGQAIQILEEGLNLDPRNGLLQGKLMEVRALSKSPKQN